MYDRRGVVKLYPETEGVVASRELIGRQLLGTPYELCRLVRCETMRAYCLAQSSFELLGNLSMMLWCKRRAVEVQVGVFCEQPHDRDLPSVYGANLSKVEKVHLSVLGYQISPSDLGAWCR